MFSQRFGCVHSGSAGGVIRHSPQRPQTWGGVSAPTWGLSPLRVYIGWPFLLGEGSCPFLLLRASPAGGVGLSSPLVSCFSCWGGCPLFLVLLRVFTCWGLSPLPRLASCLYLLGAVPPSSSCFVSLPAGGSPLFFFWPLLGGLLLALMCRRRRQNSASSSPPSRRQSLRK